MNLMLLAVHGGDLAPSTRSNSEQYYFFTPSLLPDRWTDEQFCDHRDRSIWVEATAYLHVLSIIDMCVPQS